jgi:hypothetical protein
MDDALAMRGGQALRDLQGPVPATPARRESNQQLSAAVRGQWGGPRHNSGGARPGAGRPRSPLGPRSRDLLKVFDELEHEGKIDAKKLVLALYEKAIGGDTGAIREFLERRFGKVRYEFAVEGQLGTIVQQLENVTDEELKTFASGGAIPASLESLLATSAGQQTAERLEAEDGH